MPLLVAWRLLQGVCKFPKLAVAPVLAIWYECGLGLGSGVLLCEIGAKTLLMLLLHFVVAPTSHACARALPRSLPPMVSARVTVDLWPWRWRVQEALVWSLATTHPWVQQ
jgi:hypothetical protein